MSIVASRSTDAQAVLDVAGEFLSRRAERHNLLNTLFHDRAAKAQPAEYWTVSRKGRVVGILFHSPLSYPAVISPMPHQAVRTLVNSIVAAGTDLPGVSGEAATAALFAGCWSELRRCGASPLQGQRLYRLGRLRIPRGVTGALRPANATDWPLVERWYRAFAAEVGQPVAARQTIRRVMSRRGLHLWVVAGRPVCLAAATEPVAQVSRIGPVYTPPEQRRRGYAGACVAGLSAELRRSGNGCILYTDLSNGSANAVYRAIGYRSQAEFIRYSFST